MGLFERLFKTDKNENEKKDLSYIYKITELNVSLKIFYGH